MSRWSWLVVVALALAPFDASAGKARDRGGSTPLLDEVREFLSEDDWPFARVDGETVVETRYKGEAGTWGVFLRTKEDAQQVLVYSILPTRTPEERRDAVAEFITRANYGMIIGNFEMDYADGEVRYKTSTDVEGGRLTQPMVRNLVYMNVLTTNKYFAGLQKVMFGSASAEEAIQEIEGPPPG